MKNKIKELQKKKDFNGWFKTRNNWAVGFLKQKDYWNYCGILYAGSPIKAGTTFNWMFHGGLFANSKIKTPFDIIGVWDKKRKK